jgi:guanylate kinase
VDYYFLDVDRFQQRAAAGEFLEHAQVYGHSYGTLQAEVVTKLRQGRDVLLNVDVQGAAMIRARARHDPELAQALLTVFLTPPTLAILEERLRRRGTEAEATIQQRLGFARRELAEWRHFDYLILSTTIAEDLRRMQAILEAEHLRQKRAVGPGLGAEPVPAV